MEEQRRQKRENTVYYLEVVERETGRPMGRVVDITNEGLMVVREEPIPVNETFRLAVELPREITGASTIELDGECRWCRQAQNEDYYEAGFSTVDISTQNLALVELLVKYFSFSG